MNEYKSVRCRILATEQNRGFIEKLKCNFLLYEKLIIRVVKNVKLKSLRI